jgi:hypothetical protein
MPICANPVESFRCILNTDKFPAVQPTKASGMNFFECIQQRYSVRAYDSQPVEDEKLAQILEAGRLAPTAANRQPVNIIVIHTAGREAELNQIYGESWFVQAPLILAVCGLPEQAWQRRRSDGKSYLDVDVARGKSAHRHLPHLPRCAGCNSRPLVPYPAFCGCLPPDSVCFRGKRQIRNHSGHPLHAHAHSAELAGNVVEGLRGQEDRVRVQAAAVLLPRHGIIVAGKSLMSTIDALERIDWNCWCILAQRMLGDA